jgi:hypothetical protein
LAQEEALRDRYTTYTLSNDGKLYLEQSLTKKKDTVASVGKKDIREIKALIAKANLTANPHQ